MGRNRVKWLITGGCGFIGSNLADALLGRGDEVVLVDNLSRIGSSENLAWLRSRYGESWRFADVDVCDADATAHIVAFERPGVVAHLAGQVAMTTSLADPRLDFETNARGTFNMLEAVRLGAPETVFLYSSTNKVYGSLENIDAVERDTHYELPAYPNGLDESLQIDGYSPYGCSKLAADQYVRDYHRMYGLRTTVFRHSSMYGGRQYATYDQGWIGWFCMKALEMGDPSAPPFTISGNGKQVRDALHGSDLVAAYFAAVEHPDAVAGHIYNIGGGASNALSLLELFRLLEDLTGNTLRFVAGPWRPGDQKVFVADTTNAEQDFGWRPTVNARTGITAMLEWVRELRFEE
ncbi:MAG: GDP-mannose 4,6-dehydratase [Coriobacteriia bacterium]|nr:GDP-mannose 4,6-dehydratase [Coriobacteriia bacterium]